MSVHHVIIHGEPYPVHMEESVAHEPTISAEHAIAAEVRTILAKVGAARMITIAQSLDHEGPHDIVDDLLAQVMRDGDALVSALTTPAASW